MANKTTSGQGKKNSTKARCSFCGKTEDEVKKIITVGENQKPICNECILTCKQILNDAL